MGIPRKILVKLEFNGESRQLILKKFSQETYLHIILKIIAYIYFWEEDLSIEPSYRRNKYRPDLLSLGQNPNPRIIDPVVKIWIECKKVKLDKLEKLSIHLPYADIYWFHQYHHLKQVLNQKILKKHPRLRQIRFIGIDGDSISRIQRDLSTGRSNWTIHREKGVFTIDIEGKDMTFLHVTEMDSLGNNVDK